MRGVLWRISPRDRVLLDAWENVAGGRYSCETFAVRWDGRRIPALVYVARPSGKGPPRPGYLELVLAAAQEWDLPASYIAVLERRATAGARWSGARKIGDFA